MPELSVAKSATDQGRLQDCARTSGSSLQRSGKSRLQTSPYLLFTQPLKVLVSLVICVDVSLLTASLACSLGARHQLAVPPVHEDSRGQDARRSHYFAAACGHVRVSR